MMWSQDMVEYFLGVLKVAYTLDVGYVYNSNDSMEDTIERYPSM